MNNQFKNISNACNEKTIKSVVALSEGKETIKMRVSIRDVQFLEEKGIIDLGDCFSESTLTQKGEEFVRWYKLQEQRQKAAVMRNRRILLAIIALE